MRVKLHRFKEKRDSGRMTKTANLGHAPPPPLVAGAPNQKQATRPEKLQRVEKRARRPRRNVEQKKKSPTQLNGTFVACIGDWCYFCSCESELLRERKPRGLSITTHPFTLPWPLQIGGPTASMAVIPRHNGTVFPGRADHGSYAN